MFEKAQKYLSEQPLLIIGGTLLITLGIAMLLAAIFDWKWIFGYGTSTFNMSAISTLIRVVFGIVGGIIIICGFLLQYYFIRK